LVNCVSGWVIREMDRWLMWGPKPSTQQNCNDKLGPKGQVKSLQPNVPILGRGLFIQLLGKGVTCGRALSWKIQVPSPEQILATVRVCLTIWQWLMED